MPIDPHDTPTLTGGRGRGGGEGRPGRRLVGFLAVALAGVVLAVAGLAWDAVEHSHDHELATHEGVFTLSNPAHLAFVVGLGLTAIGVIGAVVTLLAESGPARRAPRWAVPALAAGAGLAFGVGGAAAMTAGPQGADHHSVATDGGAGRSPAPAEAGHRHDGHGKGASLGSHASHGLAHDLQQYPDVAAATPAQRAAAQRLYDRSKATAQRYRSVDAARAAGYRIDSTRTTAKGRPARFLHARNPAYRADGRTVDPDHPEALVYLNPPDHKLVLVGVLYVMPPGRHGPDLGGPITRWHQHEHCFDAAAPAGQRRRPLPAGGTCPSGFEKRRGPEMMHVWLTGDLRSAYAVRAPHPELRRAFGASLGKTRRGGTG